MCCDDAALALQSAIKSMVNVGSQETIKTLLVKKYAELGPITFQQVAVLVHFSILVALWFFREPRFIN